VPTASDPDKTIRAGLKSLIKADRVVLRAATLLDRMEGHGEPPPPDKAFPRFTFVVEDGGYTYRYRGRMTKEQHAYLDSKTGSLAEFALAFLVLSSYLHSHVGNALAELKLALEAPASSARRKPSRADDPGGGGGIIVPSETCCTYDMQPLRNIPKGDCIGMGGSYSDQPCPPKGHPKRR
jgi:hypothetical protein